MKVLETGEFSHNLSRSWRERHRAHGGIHFFTLSPLDAQREMQKVFSASTYALRAILFTLRRWVRWEEYIFSRRH